MHLSGKRVLVTGAASGIGEATARRLATGGARLVLTDINVEGLSAIAKELSHATDWHGPCDVADHDAVLAMAADAGPVDVVMNIAGVSTWGAIDRLEHRHWQKMIDINLLGPISVMEAFVPQMIERKQGGHIVNVSSAAGLFGLPWHAAYSASKFGLRGVSEVLRFDLARYKIGVTLVCPGGVDTPLVQTVDIVGVDKSNDALQKLVAHFRKRAKTPDQVAKSIVDGVEKDRYLVMTSPDIVVGHLAQRYFPLGYNLAMKLLNDRMYAVARKALVPK